jgi:hypothetical protein
MKSRPHGYTDFMPYPARPIPFDPRDYATAQSLRRAAAFVKGADADTRQKVIDYVVTAQAFNKDYTKSLLYSANLNQPGRNVGGNIQIGPLAFEQDLAWLAGVVFHELIHSPQNAYYAANGVTQIDPNRSETERRMIALDEYEAYSWSLTRSAELGLSQTQQAEIRRRANFALIDLDDAKAKSLAQGQRFDAARDELIRQFNAAPTAARTTMSRSGPSACYA